MNFQRIRVVQQISWIKQMVICLMLSRQQTAFHFNSPKKNSSNQKYSFLVKTCSSSALKQTCFDKSQDLEEPEEKVKYSKLLKQKDLKIINLTERVRSAEQELATHRNSSSCLQNDLHFFKSKIQQEFYRNVCLQSELEILNSAIKNIVVKMVPMFKGNQQSMASIAKHLEQLKVHQDGSNPQGLQVSKQLLSSIQFQIEELSRSFYIVRKEPEVQKSLMRSADLKSQYRVGDEAQKEKLKHQISELISHYQTKMVDSQDYRQQIMNLRSQREYIKGLLLSTEKEKNTFVNEIYEVARRQYQIDFQRMNKPEVVKLSITLLAKIKELEADKQRLQKQLKAVEEDEKTKYQNMLRQVKRIEKHSEKKVSIRRLQSLPFN